MNNQSYLTAGLFTTTLRWVVGWTYFSAFWRRLILENKLNPEEAGYIGEKFNHFLPNALGIKPLIEYLVSNPEVLWWAMAVFTIVEGIVGLLLILGLFTRLMSIGVFLLALGILLGSGWIGTTCLDEWQIGVLGIASGFILFLSGGGKYAIDGYWISRNKKRIHSKWFQWLGSAALPLRTPVLNTIVLSGSLAIFGLTLFTNQYFHGGVYGKLHNKSVRPELAISSPNVSDTTFSFVLSRIEGADVYGSFLIGIKLTDENGVVVFEKNQTDLSQLKATQINNAYVAKIKPGKHSLILPLGASATLSFQDQLFRKLSGNYTLELTDISGLQWKKAFEIRSATW